jgi:hypothetical protein
LPTATSAVTNETPTVENKPVLRDNYIAS